MANRAAIATRTAKTKSAKKPAGKKPGTRIDDSAVLIKLASALRRSPDIAVTAALRKIGIKDQASVRRISGKYAKEQAALKRRAAAAARARKSKSGKSARAQMAAQPLLSKTPAVKRSPGKKSTKKTSATAKPASGTRAKKATLTTPRPAESRPGRKTAASAAQRQQTPAPKAATAASPLLPFVNTGLDLSTAAFTTQLQLYKQMMQMAPVKTMVRQQIEFNQAMMSLFKMPLSGFLNGSKKPKSK